MIDIYMRNLKDAIVRPFITLVEKQTFSPNYITLGSGVIGVIGILCSTQDWRYTALIVGILGRILDGLDGAYARLTNQTSDFGGYLDILVDFTCYGLCPLGVTIAHPHLWNWITCVLLEVTFFVNAAGLFFLSALIEKNANAKKEYEKDKKEVTTLKMPPALIEGTESLAFFFLIIMFCEYIAIWFTLFALGVTITILQRIHWASKHL